MNNNFRDYVDNPQETYPDTYNLWQTSQYYDTNNFDLRNFTYKERENPKKTSYEEAMINPKNVRVIPRNSLYEDPELFQYPLDFTTTPQDPNYECYYSTIAPMLGEHWVEDWKRVSESSRTPMVLPIGSRPHGSHRMHNYFNRPSIDRTVESMVRNGGWHGEDLAKAAERLLEPIGSHTVYNINPMQDKNCFKPSLPQQELKTENFNTNVLLNILEFVKNDTETEIVFHRTLRKEERKRIHCLVNEVINGENSTDYDNVAQMDIVKKIHEHNRYMLATHTEGAAPNRRVSVFKEAPSHIYLVTPDDLRVQRPPEPTEESDDQSLLPIATNPFLKSITKKIVDSPHAIPTQYSAAVTNIIEYFREFSLRPTYMEFRFLGPFTRREIEFINIFLGLISRCVDNKYDGVRQDMVDIYKNIRIKLKILPDINGSIMVQKAQKGDRRETKI